MNQVFSFNAKKDENLKYELLPSHLLRLFTDEN